MTYGILTTVSIVLSSTGIIIGFAVFIYVRCIAIKDMDGKLESIEEAQLSIPNNKRIGIEPKKEVVVHHITNQGSTRATTRSTVTGSTYFVSYFGMCFQKEPFKVDGNAIELQKSSMTSEDSVQKVVVIDEERGNTKPVQSIEIPQHDLEPNNHENKVLHTNTSSTDGGQSSVDSSLSDPYNKEDIFSNNPDFVTYQTHNAYRNNNTNVAYHSRKDHYTEPRQDIFQTDPQYGKDERRGQSFDIGQQPVSSNDGNKYDDDSNNDDDDSFHTPEQCPFYENRKSITIKQDSNFNNPHSAPLKNEILQVVYDAAPTNTYNSPNIFSDKANKHPTQNTISKTRTFQSENESYFSSDDDKSSQMDNNNYCNSASPGVVDFDTSKYSATDKTDLTLPDLEHSADSDNQSGADSGDWELSSSSEDRSDEEVLSTKNHVRTTTKKRQIVNHVDKRKEDLTKSSSIYLKQQYQSKPQQQPKMDTCPFCNHDYNVGEGMKFSFDDRCPHFMCVRCCEEGKAAKFNGECPLCDFLMPSIRRNRFSMPPRAGERREKQEQVVMTI